jgi:hypothetical protein
MKPNLQFNISKFSEFTKEMSQKTGISVKKIIRNEAFEVCIKSMELTKVASAGKIKKRIKNQTGWISYNGKKYLVDAEKGKLSYTVKTGENAGKKVIRKNAGNYYKNSLWRELKNISKKILENSLKARGLSKQTWYFLAKKLNPTLAEARTPNFVKNAVANGKFKFPVNAETKEFSAISLFYVYIKNSNPKNKFNGAVQAFNKALNGRINFFKQNVKQGVFKEIKDVASKYKGLDIK